MLLAQAGCRLALVGRRESALTETVQQISSGSLVQPGTIIIPADLSDDAQACSVIDVTVQTWGRVDALVNNAAVLDVRPIAETDADVLYTTFATNVFGPAHMVSQCWPVFVRQRGGCVVNVSSVATEDPFPNLGVYAASKCALEGLTRTIAVEGAAHGIRAFSVAPGAVETAMLRQVVSAAQLPTESVLSPLEVARVIAECVLGGRDNQSGGRLRVARD